MEMSPRRIEGNHYNYHCVALLCRRGRMTSGTELETKGWAWALCISWDPWHSWAQCGKWSAHSSSKVAHKNPELPLFLGSHPTPGHHQGPAVSRKPQGPAKSTKARPLCCLVPGKRVLSRAQPGLPFFICPLGKTFSFLTGLKIKL